jgi:hypothetical protein
LADWKLLATKYTGWYLDTGGRKKKNKKQSMFFPHMSVGLSSFLFSVTLLGDGIVRGARDLGVKLEQLRLVCQAVPALKEN